MFLILLGAWAYGGLTLLALLELACRKSGEKI